MPGEAAVARAGHDAHVARLYLALFVANLVLVVVALIDCLGGEEEPRNLSRLVWTLIILFFSLVGPIAWFLVGRPERAERGAGPGSRRRAGKDTPAETQPRPVAPDDDPEFLDSLKAQQRDADDEMFRRWEADLRRREDDLRRRDDDDPPDAPEAPPTPGPDDKR